MLFDLNRLSRDLEHGNANDSKQMINKLISQNARLQEKILPLNPDEEPFT